MYRLFYISKANQGFTETELDNLVQQASAKNLEARVTGAMSYNGERFAQILEGEELTVKSLFSKIATDPRHGEIRIMKQLTVSSREYLQWGMLKMESADFSELHEVMEL